MLSSKNIVIGGVYITICSYIKLYQGFMISGFLSESISRSALSSFGGFVRSDPEVVVSASSMPVNSSKTLLSVAIPEIWILSIPFSKIISDFYIIFYLYAVIYGVESSLNLPFFVGNQSKTSFLGFKQHEQFH